MKLNFTIPANVIKALLLTASTDCTRYILQNICLELTRVYKASDDKPDSPVHPAWETNLVTTDGRRLSVMHNGAELDLMQENGWEGEEFLSDGYTINVLIPAPLLKLALKVGKPLQFLKDRFGFECTIDARKIRIFNTDLELIGTVFEGNYPAWRQVVPDMPVLPASDLCVNPEFFGDFNTIAGLLSNKRNNSILVVRHGREGQPPDEVAMNPITILVPGVPDYFGILMPMRHGESREERLRPSTGGIPSWLKRKTKEAPKTNV